MLHESRRADRQANVLTEDRNDSYVAVKDVN